MTNKMPEYQKVENRPIMCTFCGASVMGRIVESFDPKTKEPQKHCKWICGRCGNLSKVGVLR
jgi:hypothetical protein